MTDRAKLFDATKAESTLLVLFIPSKTRDKKRVQQKHWVDRALEVLGQLFGGATAFPRGVGVWRDDEQGGELLFDEPVVIQCYTNEAAIETNASALRKFLVEMGEKTRQGAVGFVIDTDYLEIRFPRTSE